VTEIPGSVVVSDKAFVLTCNGNDEERYQASGPSVICTTIRSGSACFGNTSIHVHEDNGVPMILQCTQHC